MYSLRAYMFMCVRSCVRFMGGCKQQQHELAPLPLSHECE